MDLRVLITGFGPFPGAPVNSTGPLIERLARERTAGTATARIATHIFPTTYRAVDRDLPLLLEHYRPDLLLMFGLAARTPWVRIESRARNAMAATIPDAEGSQPRGACIAPGEPAFLAFPAALRHLLRGHMRAGATVRLSRDAGRYLCNYLCWKAVEATRRPGGPAFAAFIHIPKIAATGIHVPKRPRHGRPQRKPPGGDVSAARLDRTAQVLLREAILIARQEKVRRRCIDGMTKP